MRSWPKHHGHEERGVPIIESLCTRLRIPTEYRNLAIQVSRITRMFIVCRELTAPTVVKILERMDAFRRPQQFYKILEACQADAEGRGMKIDYKQAALWRYILAECAKINHNYSWSKDIPALPSKRLCINGV